MQKNDLEQKVNTLESKHDALALDFEKDQTRDYKRIQEFSKRLDDHIKNGATVHAGQPSNIPRQQPPEEY